MAKNDPSVKHNFYFLSRKLEASPLEFLTAWPQEEKKKTEKIEKPEAIQKKRQSCQGDEQGRSEQRSAKRAEKVESVAGSVVCFLLKVEPVRNDKQVSSQEA